jgi:hypothetical protein
MLCSNAATVLISIGSHMDKYAAAKMQLYLLLGCCCCAVAPECTVQLLPAAAANPAAASCQSRILVLLASETGL